MNLFAVGSKVEKLKKFVGDEYAIIKQKLAGPKEFLDRAQKDLMPVALKIINWLTKKALEDGAILAEDMAVVEKYEKEAVTLLPALEGALAEAGKIATEAGHVIE